ncbi:MAG: CDP-diacylglycerol--glycerol-3-phosphate 3-phosphatidyltransferase [Holosporales bacterium]|jgi:cardiolipin synthase|nr:CDP-diacylglycerol--glycerol-3-phosphate 3-phosphatidyltransferase [Holosporales bacterium]
MFRKELHKENLKFCTTPNLLTFSRVAAVPLLVIAFFIREPIGNYLALFIIIAASLTDYVDGYIARRFCMTSKIGAFLDPLADKLLISVALLLLAGSGKIGGYDLIPAAIIICRELIISGLREFLGAMGLELPVLLLAKYKTAVQMVAITCLFYNAQAPGQHLVQLIGELALWAACVLTVITGARYVLLTIGFIKSLQLQKHKIEVRRKRRRSG